MVLSYSRSTIFFILLFCSNIIAILGDCNLSQVYLIRSTTAGLTVDANEPSAVKVQYFNGLPPQQWKFECGSRLGLFYIVNIATGSVLDIVRNSSPHYVVMNAIDGTLNQQWTLNANGRIVNAGNGEVLEIENGYLVAGSLLQTYEDNGSPPQKFILQEKV